MELYTIYIIILVFLILLYSIFVITEKHAKNLPPKAWGFPLVGRLPFLIVNNPMEDLLSLKKQHGDVFRVQIGTNELYILASHKVIKEALLNQGDIFSHRPQFSFNPEEFNQRGIAMRDYTLVCSEMRQSTIKILKDLGMGKSKLETHIQTNIQQLLQYFEQHQNEPVQIGPLLCRSILANIYYLLFGEHDEKEIQQLVKPLSELVETTSFAAIDFIFPWLKKIPFSGKLLNIEATHKPWWDIIHWMEDKIHRLELRVNRNECNTECFVGSLIRQSKEYPQRFPRPELSHVCKDLIGGGTDTISVTIHWFLLYMIEFPEVQVKVQQEIDNVVGKERSPTMSDLTKLPYTEATIMETHRFASIFPVGLFHRTCNQSNLAGYTIPSNSIIAPFLKSIHFDDQHFTRPDLFYPDRFIINGKVKKSEQLMPFTIGKRACLGKSLARMELFLYITSILQKFTISKPDGHKINLEPNFALVLSPKPQDICVLLRK